jgi:hypothetical protein
MGGISRAGCSPQPSFTCVKNLSLSMAQGLDGSITAPDALRVLSAAVGLEVELVCPICQF